MNNVIFSFHDVLKENRRGDFGTKEENEQLEENGQLEENEQLEEPDDFDITQYIQQFFEEDNEQDQLCLAHHYDASFSVKDLIKICEYYGIHKQCQKCKKMEVIYSILMYENDPTNARMVEKRKAFWGYMEELKQDKFMKRFVIW